MDEYISPTWVVFVDGTLAGFHKTKAEDKTPAETIAKQFKGATKIDIYPEDKYIKLNQDQKRALAIHVKREFEKSCMDKDFSNLINDNISNLLGSFFGIALQSLFEIEDEVKANEANKYSQILSLLGMDEDGDPVDAVKQLMEFRDKIYSASNALRF